MLQGTAEQGTKGPKTFTCPLCSKVQHSKNAKQHILTLKCSPEKEVPDTAREFLSTQIKFNRFLIMEEKLETFNESLPKVDSILVRYSLMILGGLILNSTFEPLPLSHFFLKLSNFD